MNGWTDGIKMVLEPFGAEVSPRKFSTAATQQLSEQETGRTGRTPEERATVASWMSLKAPYSPGWRLAVQG
jgi:hypothetical protein